VLQSLPGKHTRASGNYSGYRKRRVDNIVRLRGSTSGLRLFKHVFNIGSVIKAARSKTRTRGRPAGTGEDDVRAALLATARRLYFKHGFAKVTARQIAAAAGTTPAMIHYYFVNKDGLFKAMVQEAIEPLSHLLSGALQSGEDAPDIGVLIAAHLRAIAANPWIATLIVNEVLAEGGRFRALFMRDIAARMLPMIVELLERERRAGRVREDLNPRLAALSLLSLNMFPFLSRVVTGPVLGVKLEGADLEELIAHTTKVFFDGIGRRSPPEEQ
jgi:TetR/AcrR family transcriptional regulator